VPPEHAHLRDTHARILIAALAPLQTLCAYPIAGSQAPFMRVLLIVVAAVLLSDGLRSLRAARRFAAVASRFARPAAAVALSALALAYPAFAWRARQVTGRSPLWLCPEPDEFTWRRTKPGTIGGWSPACAEIAISSSVCPVYPASTFGPVNRARSGAHSTGPLNWDDWMLAYSAAEQQAIVDDLERYPGACAVYHPSGVAFWNRGRADVQRWPLAKYILTRFKTVGRSVTTSSWSAPAATRYLRARHARAAIAATRMWANAARCQRRARFRMRL